MIRIRVCCDAYIGEGREKCSRIVESGSYINLQREMSSWCWFTDGDRHYCSKHSDEYREKAGK